MHWAWKADWDFDPDTGRVTATALDYDGVTVLSLVICELGDELGQDGYCEFGEAIARLPQMRQALIEAKRWGSSFTGSRVDNLITDAIGGLNRVA